MIRRLTGLLALVVATAACADDEITGLVGGGLLRGGTVRTIELVLDAPAFLRGAESATGFTRASDGALLVVAHDYEGVVDAHTLARFADPPATISYDDDEGVTHTDSMPTLVGGAVVLAIDSARSGIEEPVELRLERIAEPWDPATATWSRRVDSASVRQAWDRPGGTTDAVLATATWEPGADSVVLPVDSQTIAAWADTSNTTRGAHISVATPGVRLFALRSAVRLRLDARPAEQPDTVVHATVAVEGATFVYDPPPAASEGLRFGGTPAWRSFLRFRERLDTMTVAVTTPEGTERVALADANVNYAALLLQPSPTPAPFVPADSINFEAREALPIEGVPLSRSPLRQRVIGAPALPLPAIAFRPGSPYPGVEVPITSFIAGLTAEPDDDDDADAAVVALLPRGLRTFGFGEFDGPDGAASPQLRLILTIVTESRIE